MKKKKNLGPFWPGAVIVNKKLIFNLKLIVKNIIIYYSDSAMNTAHVIHLLWILLHIRALGI